MRSTIRSKPSQNLLYLLEQDTAGQANAHGYVLLAQEELARVSQIVVQTLRFHRQATHPTACRASGLVEQVLGLYRGRLVAASITVQVRFRDDAPLRCREGEIRQVLANLVGNAADAMNGGGRLLLRTRARTDPKSGRRGVLFTVADTGHGIPPATLQRIFEPFLLHQGRERIGPRPVGLERDRRPPTWDRYASALHLGREQAGPSLRSSSPHSPDSGPSR